MPDTETFIEHAIKETEIETISFVIKLLDKYPAEMVKDNLKKYVKELREGLSHDRN